MNPKEEIGEPKVDHTKVDLYNMADDKGHSGLSVVPVNSFPDGGDQTSPVTPIPNSTPSQLLQYRPSSSGDAMLSAINYNESEILQDGAFDVTVAASLPNLDEGILSNMGTQNSGTTFDLFDGEGNVNDSYEMEGLSPQPFSDPASGLVGGSNLVIDTDSIGSMDQGKLMDGSKKKKMKQSKNFQQQQGSPSRLHQIQCPTCNKLFNNSSALAKHRLTHSDERKYVCNLCQKAFKRQDHLNGHLMTHRDKKPYECTVENCQKSYCDARSLRRHLENHHNQSPEQIQEAIAKVASNAAAVIAEAAASNTLSIRASTAHQTQIVGSIQAGGSISSVATNQSESADGSSIQDNGFSSSHFSNSSTPVTSPTYGAQQQPFFPFEQQKQHRELELQTQQQIPVSLGHEGDPHPATMNVQPRIALQHHAQLQQHHQQQQQEPPWQETFQAYKQTTGVDQQPNPQTSPNGDHSPNYLGQVSPISPVPTTNLNIIPPQTVINNSSQVVNFHGNTSANIDKASEESKPIICTMCDRRFKNIQALNGHMRLHGGFIKKEHKDDKKGKKVGSNHDMTPPPSMVLKNSKSSSLSAVSQSFHMSLDQVGSPPQTHAAGPYHGHLQSPVAPESPVNESAPVAQVILQPFRQQQEQQMQLQQQQQREQQLQQQLQQQIQLEQQINQHLEKEQLIQHEQQLQQHLQQQIQQLQMEQQQLQQHFQQQISKEQQALDQQNQIQLIHQNNQPGSVPQSPQIAHSPQLQRQVSVESSDYDYQQPPLPQQTLTSHLMPENTASHLAGQDIPANMAAQIHLQQLAQRQEQQRCVNQQRQHIDLNLHTKHNTAEPIPSSSQVSLNSLQPSQNLNAGTIQSNLQPVFAQGHVQQQYDLQASQIKQEVMSPVSAPGPYPNSGPLSTSQVTLATSTTNQAMAVAQLLNSMENSDFNMSNAMPTSPRGTEQNTDYVKNDPLYSEQQQDSPFGNSLKHDILDILDNKSHIDLNAFSDMDLSKHDIFDQISNSTSKHSKAAESNPFSFPQVDYDSNPFSNKDSSQSDSIQSRHKELRRRLSLGNDYEYKGLNCVSPNNISGFLPKDTAFIKPSPTVGNHSNTKPESRPRMRSKSGDDYKYMRSQSEDHTFMRPRSRTEASLWKFKTHNSWDNGQMLSKSDGAGQFRNPNMLGGTLKHRRKHRPAPLFIPTHMNSGIFQSRLRSPRIIHTDERKGNTPPPYTPPPMLSPIRSGSGLFCSITGYKPVTPKSAPITPRGLLSSHRSSIASLKQDSVEETVEEVAAELEEEQPPETDVQPHVNIGPMYQAEIPPFNVRKSDALRTISKEDLVWDPVSMGEASDDDVQYYQDLACSAAIWGNGCNVEYALHLLHIMQGNVQDAMLKLMEGKVSVPRNHTLLSYTYQECDAWTVEEIEKFQQALWKCDKDFFAISKEVGTKTTKECVQQYYLWKKVCPEEHKRLRIIRRKREQDRLYNLRSQQQQQQQQQQPKMEDVDDDLEFASVSSEEGDDQNDRDDVSIASSVSASPAPVYTCDYPECNASFPSKQGLNGHARIHGGQNNKVFPPGEGRGPGRPQKPQTNANRLPLEEQPPGESFPCKLCGRVFSKVKSRSAHMKSHRMAENDKNKNKHNFEISVNKIQGSPNG